MSRSDQADGAASGSFVHELRVRVAEASAQVQAAEVLGDQVQASIASSDLADLRAMAARNDVDLTEADVVDLAGRSEPTVERARESSG